MHHVDADKAYNKKAWRELHKNATSYIKQIPVATSNKTATERPLTSYPNKMDKTCRTLLEK